MECGLEGVGRFYVSRGSHTRADPRLANHEHSARDAGPHAANHGRVPETGAEDVHRTSRIKDRTECCLRKWRRGSHMRKCQEAAEARAIFNGTLKNTL